MRHIFIINPVAGTGRSQEKLEKIIDSELRNTEINYEIYVTKYKGDIENYIASKCSDNIQTVFYACGGDGTLHETINAAYKFNNITIGVIPLGSGNDFIKNFNNYENFSDIVLQTEGESIEIDLLKVNNTYAATVLNIGLDADVAFNMHKFKKIPFIKGTTRYYLSILSCLFNKLGKYIEVKTDKEAFKGSFLIGVAANGQYYGSGYKCAPIAELNDGIIDLCFVNKISRLKILGVIGSYKKGEHLNNPKINKFIRYIKTEKASFKFNEATNVCMDGEKYIYDEVNVSIEKNALKFWIPKGVSVKNNKSPISA